MIWSKNFIIFGKFVLSGLTAWVKFCILGVILFNCVEWKVRSGFINLVGIEILN